MQTKYDGPFSLEEEFEDQITSIFAEYNTSWEVEVNHVISSLGRYGLLSLLMHYFSLLCSQPLIFKKAVGALFLQLSQIFLYAVCCFSKIYSNHSFKYCEWRVIKHVSLLWYWSAMFIISGKYYKQAVIALFTVDLLYRYCWPLLYSYLQF